MCAIKRRNKKYEQLELYQYTFKQNMNLNAWKRSTHKKNYSWAELQWQFIDSWTKNISWRELIESQST